LKAGFARAVLIACVGAAFMLVAVWAFVRPIVSDLQSGQVVLVTATRTHITWSHIYRRRDDAVYFAAKVLTDISGAVAFGGLGLLLLYVGVRSVREGADARASPRSKKIATLWAMTSLASFGVHLMLLVVPYLIRAGLLS
jgi:hypothetical protein